MIARINADFNLGIVLDSDSGNAKRTCDEKLATKTVEIELRSFPISGSTGHTKPSTNKRPQGHRPLAGPTAARQRHGSRTKTGFRY